MSFTPSAIDSLVSPSAIDPSLVDPAIDTSPVDPPDNLQCRIRQFATAEPYLAGSGRKMFPGVVFLQLGSALLALDPRNRSVCVSDLLHMVTGKGGSIWK